MTYDEWAATVGRGVTITPEMAFEAGAASQAMAIAAKDAEIAELKNALGYDWDRFKASQKALREHMQMVAQKDAEIAELVAALECVLPWVITQTVACCGLKCREQVCISCEGEEDAEKNAQIACEKYHIAKATLAKVRKP